MAYEQFDSKSTRKRVPTMGIRADGRLRLNSDATNLVLELGIKKVFLLWDAQRKRIALKRAPENDNSAYKLIFSKAKNSIDIGAKAFLKHLGLDLEHTLDARIQWNADEEMFEVRLPKNSKKAERGL